MAAYSSFKRFSKLGRLVFSSNFKTYNLQRTCCTISHAKSICRSNKILVRIEVNPCRIFNRLLTTTIPTDEEGTKNLEEFRNREEQREQDFNKKSINDDNEKMDKIRTDILTASLQFVELYGWSREAIVKGAESIGYPGIVHGLFPNGSIELIHHFYGVCNKRTFDIIADMKIQNLLSTNNPIDLVKQALKIRLQMNEPYLNNWPQALAIMALPPNVPTSLALQLTLVDDICFHAGDRSVDFGWYTRRIGLASIYKLIELYMLRDKSPNFVDTWQFLDRRIDDGRKIHSTLVLGEETSMQMSQTLSSVFLTARNILGLNFNRR